MAIGDSEEIKSRLNIVDVLGQYLRLEKTGTNHRALCPFHNEKSPSFMVSEEKQIWHCFGCQKGGDIFSFVMEIEGVDFREALKLLAQKAGVELQSYNPQKAEEKNRTLEILELATKWYEHQLWNGPGKARILPYLYDRGLRDEAIKEFRLGYAPRGWRNMLSFLQSRGYRADEIMKTGLLVEKSNSQLVNSNLKEEITPNSYDRFRDRIMFPIADYSGKILGYSARVAPGQDESQAKYVNTPETEVYHKSKVLYGIDKARGEIKQKDFALLVEGNMDVIASWQAGIKNTVAVSGTALTDEQLKIIKRYTPKIKMFFDADAAGETATKKSIKTALNQDFGVGVVTLPHGKDAADIAKEDPQGLMKAVEKSKNVMDYFFEKNFSKFDRKKVEDKKNIVDNLLDVISGIAGAIEKNHWLKKLSFELDIPEGTLTDMLKKVNLKERVGESGAKNGKADNFVSRSKKEMLADEVVGLILVSKEAWEEGKKEEYRDIFLLEDSLLNLLLASDEPFDFDGNFSKIGEDGKKRAEKLYFEHKYRLNINNSLEEIIIEDPVAEFKGLFREIQKERQKEYLQKITRDLKDAEDSGDAAAAKLLLEESKKISDNFSQIT